MTDAHENIKYELPTGAMRPSKHRKHVMQDVVKTKNTYSEKGDDKKDHAS